MIEEGELLSAYTELNWRKRIWDSSPPIILALMDHRVHPSGKYLLPQGHLKSQELFRDHCCCWDMALLPAEPQTSGRMHPLASHLGQFTEDGLEEFCRMGCFVQCFVQILLSSLPVTPKALLLTVNLLAQTARRNVVELWGTSLAGSWFWLVGFGFLPFAASQCLMGHD